MVIEHDPDTDMLEAASRELNKKVVADDASDSDFSDDEIEAKLH